MVMRTKIDTGSSVNKISLVLTTCLVAAFIPLNTVHNVSTVELSWVTNLSTALQQFLLRD